MEIDIKHNKLLKFCDTQTSIQTEKHGSFYNIDSVTDMQSVSEEKLTEVLFIITQKLIKIF